MRSFKSLREEKPGLYANIHAKRARIKAGSGEKMRKPGSEGAPTPQDWKDAAKTAKEEVELDELDRSTLASYVAKASDARKHKNLSTAKVDKRYSGVAKAIKRLDAKEEVELDEALRHEIAGAVGQFIGNKIDPVHGEIMRTHGKEAYRQAAYHIRKTVRDVSDAVSALHDKLHRHLRTGKLQTEEVELGEEQMYYSIVHKPTNKVLSTHKSLESAKDEHRGMDQGVRAHYYITTSKKEPKTFSMKEEVEHLEEKHRVQVTISDPNHTMVSKRGEKIQKHIRITADDKESAVSKAKAHYKKQGYNVHGAEHVGMVNEGTEMNEAVTVKKQNYSWGKMMTVHHGNETSYPLHPEHQAKIKALGDGEKTSFKDETKRTVIAHRDGDIIHLSGAGTSKKTAVKRSHFTESYYKDQEIERQEDERLAKQAPFNPDKPKKTAGAKAGKYGSAYSRVRHLARMALKNKAGMKEEAELDEGKYGAFRLGPGVGRFSSRGRAPYQGLEDPRTGLPLGFSHPPKKDEPKKDEPEKKKEAKPVGEAKVRVPKETGFEKSFRKITGKSFAQHVKDRTKEMDDVQANLERQRKEYIKQGIIKEKN